MIKFENTQVAGFEPAIRGMRNPKNSWHLSDSGYCKGRDKKCDTCPFNPGDYEPCHSAQNQIDKLYVVGPNDYNLMTKLWKAGTDHRKYLRMIIVWVDITAPLYWWKEFDTYKVGTVANSCSTMHKLGEKEFTLDDFSHEHLGCFVDDEPDSEIKGHSSIRDYVNELKLTIEKLNHIRQKYLFHKERAKNKELSREERAISTYKKEFFWWQMIQLLPSSYNQKRTVMMSYEMLANAYKSRKNHKLDEWKKHDEMLYKTKLADELSRESIKGQYGFCDWIEELPYSEFITGEFDKD